MNRARLVTVILILCIVAWVTSQRKEHFEVLPQNADIQYVNDPSGDPWMRHPVSSSLPIDMPTKYTKAYYYELDNAEYDAAITKTFMYPCAKAPEVLNAAEWRLVDLEAAGDTSDVRVAYTRLLQFLHTRLNTSEYMKIPTDNPQKRSVIQIVHDILLEAKRHKTTPYKYVMNAELILYRESKYHGKHVRVKAMVEYDAKSKTWNCYVTEAEVIGVVYEDTIGMFPVVANYTMQSTAMSYDALQKGQTSVIPAKETTDDVVKRQQQLQADNIATNIALMS